MCSQGKFYEKDNELYKIHFPVWLGSLKGVNAPTLKIQIPLTLVCIYIIIMSHCKHRSLGPSLTIRLYCPSPPGGLSGYILCKQRAIVYVLAGRPTFVRLCEGSTELYRLWVRPYFSSSFPHIWRSLWCNGYRRRKWTWRHEFKSDCISHSTNTLGKGMNPIILPPAMGK